MKKIITVVLLLSMFTSSLHALTLAEKIKYKEVDTGYSTLLVERFSGKVKYHLEGDKWIALDPLTQLYYQNEYEQSLAPKVTPEKPPKEAPEEAPKQASKEIREKDYNFEGDYLINPKSPYYNENLLGCICAKCNKEFTISKDLLKISDKVNCPSCGRTQLISDLRGWWGLKYGK